MCPIDMGFFPQIKVPTGDANGQEGGGEKKKQRVKSLDTFRGIRWASEFHWSESTRPSQESSL